MTRAEKQLRAYRSELAIERLIVVLRTELDLATERRHLDRLVELIALHIDHLDGTVRASGYRAAMAPLRARVESVCHLRVVQ